MWNTCLRGWHEFSGHFFYSDAPIFHLPTVAFDADGAGRRKFVGGFQDFAVAEAVGHAIFDGDFDFVPVASAIVLQILIRAGERVITALQLPAAEEDAAVRIRRRAKFEAQNEILREILSSRKLLDSAAFSRSGDDQSTVLRHKASVRAVGLTIEAHGLVYDRPGRGIWV